MGLKQVGKGGRPSKGPRHTFVVKLDLARASKLRELLEALDTDGVSHLSPLIAQYVDSIDLQSIRKQEALPIAKAS